MVRVLAVGHETVKYGGVAYFPGQAFNLPERLAAELIARGKAWVPNGAPDWWEREGRVLAVEPCADQPYTREPLAGSLRIVQGCAYDPGNAVYRFHSAVNEHTKHASAFVTWRKPTGNPFQCPTQYEATQPANVLPVRALVYDADVLHHHVDYYLRNAGLGNKPRPGQLVIKHYHGTMPKGGGMQHPIRHAVADDAMGAVLVGARLTLCALRPGRIQWLPITVPVARYRALREATVYEERRTFRVAHSPTRAEYKGTKVFLDACRALQKRGLPIEPVLITGKSHAEALRMKAECDAVFDSFWLGIQGSGLEGGAMGLPVIAGDPDVRALYLAEIGECPYTYANARKELEFALERLAKDPEYRRDEAERVTRYVSRYHDYPAVARRYEEILEKALGRADVRTA